MTNTEKILEEFDEIFPTFNGGKKAIRGLVKSFLTTKIAQAIAEDREKVRGEIKKLDNYKMTKPWSGIVETFIVKSDLLSSLDKPLPDKLTKK